jgi:hypothetical protein
MDSAILNEKLMDVEFECLYCRKIKKANDYHSSTDLGACICKGCATLKEKDGMIFCPTCNQLKNQIRFGKRSNSPTGYSKECRICFNKRVSDYRHREKEKILKLQKAIELALRGFKFNCCSCEEKCKECLDFYYVDQTTSTECTVDRKIDFDTTDYEIIVKELHKCCVLCKNCQTKISVEEYKDIISNAVIQNKLTGIDIDMFSIYVDRELKKIDKEEKVDGSSDVDCD